MLDKRLVEAVSRAFRLDPAAVTAETGPADVEKWDSVGHLMLVMEVEAAFQVRFPTEEIPTLTSVGRLSAALARRGAL